MLSYQHIYHAGNLADVQKHALLAYILDYLTQKDKPLSYIETHAGRGFRGGREKKKPRPDVSNSIKLSKAPVFAVLCTPKTNPKNTPRRGTLRGRFRPLAGGKTWARP